LKLKLSDKSQNAAHTDIIAAAKDFLELTKSGKVKRMIIVYESKDEDHYSAAGIRNFREAFGLLEQAKFLLHGNRINKE